MSTLWVHFEYILQWRRYGVHLELWTTVMSHKASVWHLSKHIIHAYSSLIVTFICFLLGSLIFTSNDTLQCSLLECLIALLSYCYWLHDEHMCCCVLEIFKCSYGPGIISYLRQKWKCLYYLSKHVSPQSTQLYLW